MSPFEEKIAGARRRQRRRYLAGFVGVIAALVLGAGTLAALNGTAIRVMPQAISEEAELRILQGFGLIAGRVVYTLSGDVRLGVHAKGFAPWEGKIGEAERGREIEARLTPLPGRLVVRAEPAVPDVRWLLDGRFVGIAEKLEVEVAAGNHQIEAQHPYYMTGQKSAAIERGQTIELTFPLAPVEGRISLRSEPSGATVAIAGQTVGKTPLDLARPGGSYPLVLSLDGYDNSAETIEITRSQPEAVRNYRLSRPKASVPPPPPPSPNVRRAEPVAPAPVVMAPKAPEPAPIPEAAPKQYKSAAGLDFRLFEPAGSFVMGSPPGELGRRANEFERQVRLGRPFYAALREVTNAQFAAFDGKTAGRPAEEPVTGIDWETAAAFCNWLSQKEGRKPFYRVKDGRVEGFVAESDGYRMLTEAEWEWLARMAGKPRQSLFVWGDDPVVPPGAGNVGDEDARGNVAVFVPGYKDGKAGIAPVGAFKAEPSGLFDQFGNVSEWTNDFYSLLPPPAGAVATDPLGPEFGDSHVVKGANWRSATRTELRPSYREGLISGRDDVGFRVGRYLNREAR